MMDQTVTRTWDVLLIGGASGTGKTSISYRIAKHFGLNLIEVDDFQVLLRRMTTPAQQPILHHWDTHPDPFSMSAEEMTANLIATGGVMHSGLEAVIANHLEENIPVVMEGDFILPALAVQPTFGEEANNGRVKGIFLIESDERQLVANYLAREPEYGEQTKRARSSWLFGQWLTAECARLGVPTLEARPWADGVERVIGAIR
ncbi:MAG: hypothetical protein LCI00_10665 [Chloroflexi bacterium]|nr:hypothetical protein [Chloroflexota bacterium]MCC6892099.1 hypothetical protein [Anaerolineae bacterium]